MLVVLYHPCEELKHCLCWKSFQDLKDLKSDQMGIKGQQEGKKYWGNLLPPISLQTLSSSCVTELGR